MNTSNLPKVVKDLMPKSSALSTMSPELKNRIWTALLGVATLLLFIIFAGGIGMFIVQVVLSLAMIYEFGHMAYSLPDQKEKRYILLFATWFISLGSLVLARSEYELLVFTFLSLFLYFLVTARRYGDAPGNIMGGATFDQAAFSAHFKELMYSLFGLFYLGFLPTFFLKIHGSANGVHWTMVFLLINWASDTGAYFAGKKYGKTKLYPLISPKKTREGALGGLACAWGVTLIYKVLLFGAMGWGAVIIVPLLVGVASQTGDLCESFLKRAFDKKDSGSILPGHGGFLDRFDGVVFSLPIMYACTRVFS